MMNGNDLQKHVGLTPRNVSHWVARGYLKPEDPNPGSGKPYEFAEREVVVATLMRYLVHAGFRTADAHRFARDPALGVSVLDGLANRLREWT